jgi:predicted Zn-dependent protease with MMP-like domain
MGHEQFRSLVGEALDQLPEQFHRMMRNVEVVVEDRPPSSVQGRFKGLILGLYQGVPLNRRSHQAMALPDKISIYKRNIEQVCSTSDEVKQQIRITVMHEIGHHFGLNEHEIREAGY